MEFPRKTEALAPDGFARGFVQQSKPSYATKFVIAGLHV
jgi:hypothetical protein